MTSLIGYITLGTNDLARAGAFYDALLASLGAKRIMTDERMLGWGKKNWRNHVLGYRTFQ